MMLDNVTTGLNTSNACVNDESDLVKSFEIAFLATVSLLGTLGNLLVISSIVHAKAVHKSGNIFLINLALADLLVTAVCVPSIISNVVYEGASIPGQACVFLGFLLITALSNSILNLSYIAIERYWVVAHFQLFSEFISKKRVCILVALNWLWCSAFATIAFISEIGLGFSCKTMTCSWNSSASKIYNYSLMFFVYWLPLTVATVFYIKLYRAVRNHGALLRRVMDSRVRGYNVRRELRLVRTILITIFVSILFWIPRGYVEFVGRDQAGRVVDKFTAWLAIANSAVNFIVYGVTNPIYRKRYRNFLKWLLCCKRPESRFNRNSRFTLSLSQRHLRRESEDGRRNGAVQVICSSPLNKSLNRTQRIEDKNDDQDQLKVKG